MLKVKKEFSELDQIRTALEGSSEDARFSAWMSLYQDEAKKFPLELERILEQSDSILKVTLSRFLAQVPELRAVEYLSRLMLSENVLVFEAAKKAFEKNNCEKKARLLIFLLQNNSLEKRLFAIEKLAQERVYDALPAFVSLIKTADEIEQISLLKAFRYLAEPKVFPLLQKMYFESKPRVRLETLFVFIKLSEGGHWRSKRFVINATTDEDSDIRRAALWGLRQNLKWNYQKIFEKAFLQDSSLEVREEALRGLCYSSKEKNIQLLLKAVQSEKNTLFSLKIEAGLLAIRSPKLKKTFWKLIKKKDFFENTRVLYYLALFEKKSLKYFNFLSKKLKQTKEPKLQALILEALAELSLAQSLAIFESILTKKTMLSYYALLGIIRLLKDECPVSVEKYFEENLLSPSYQEMLLKELLKVKQNHLSEKRLLHLLSGSESASTVSIHYLAALNLAKLESEAGIEQILNNCVKEKDIQTLESYQKIVLSFFKSRPEFLLKLLEKNNTVDFNENIFKLVSALDFSDPVLEKVICKGVDLYRKLDSSELQKSVFRMIYNFLGKSKMTFNKVMSLLGDQETLAFLEYLKNEKLSFHFYTEEKEASFYSFALSLLTKKNAVENVVIQSLLKNSIQELSV